ncbi:MAG: hypothetical protein JXM69_00885 [Anaerolineae bacterium]|nr:hypothetical protein [Anaerolineae bacterium]
MSTIEPDPMSSPAAGQKPDISIDYQTITGPSPVEYGTNGWWTDQDADLWRERYAQLNPALVRIHAVQGMLEPQNDDADPQHINWQGFMFDQPLPWFERTITFRQWLETLRDNDMTVMLTVSYLSGWLSANGDKQLFSTYPPREPAEYREYLLALLTFVINEVSYPPELVILEPVNEPDLDCGQDPNVPCFWENWQMDDLVAVLGLADDVAATVDPAIRLVGVSECCGTRLADQLMAEYDGQTWLDGFTYHRYVNKFDFSDGLAQGEHLAGYRKPVYLNEYGNTRSWSNGREGALWHAVVLPQIWQAGINPVQFTIAEFPGSHEEYKQLGLFKDWENDWQLKPAYWVYRNFYHYFGRSELVSVTKSVPVTILAGRGELMGGTAYLAIWLTNDMQKEWNSLRFEIVDFPVDQAQAQVYDNFQSDQPLTTIDLVSSPLQFDVSLPPTSSYLIVIKQM